MLSKGSWSNSSDVPPRYLFATAREFFFRKYSFLLGYIYEEIVRRLYVKLGIDETVSPNLPRSLRKREACTNIQQQYTHAHMYIYIYFFNGTNVLIKTD